jgi:WD40 repeat protein
VWDIVEGKQMHVLEGHTDFVYHACFFEKQGEEAGMKVLSTGADGTLRVRAAKTVLMACV